MKDSYKQENANGLKKSAPSDASAYKSEGGKMAEKNRNSSLDKQGEVKNKDMGAYSKAGVQDQKKQAGA